MPYIRKALEALWLLTTILVPVVYVTHGYMIAEAENSFVEVPKITLLRSLVGLMLVFWALEWALSAKITRLPSPRVAIFQIRSWVREHPTRWVVLVVVALMALTILSTLLSAAPRVSWLGEVEAQDNYSAYTMLTYMVLFLVVASHLRNRDQIIRLMGALVITGILVGGMAILQEYDLEPFSWMELPLAGDRVTSTMGNPIFAAAVLVLTIPVTLGLAMYSLDREWTYSRSGLWSMALVVQLLGITFTLSRGPWIGLAFALALFTALAWFSIGRTGMFRAVGMIGVMLAITLAVVFLTASWRSGEAEGAGATGQVSERFKSISFSSGLSSRRTIWEDTAEVIVSRPWFEFEDLSYSFLRPIIGYGPDLFRFTFLLKSSPLEEGAAPAEADQAHNMLLHQTVELGYAGLLIWLALLAAPLVVGGLYLACGRGNLSRTHKWILVALLGVLAGRAVEQMVGISRVGDFTLWWVILGLFVALPIAMSGESAVTRPPARRRQRRGIIEAQVSSPFNIALVGLTAFLALGIGWFTWTQNINYARAAVEVGAASSDLKRADGSSALKHIDRSIDLAPHMAPFYTNRAQLLDLRRRQAETEGQVVAHAQEAYNANLEAVRRDPLYYRSRLALAQSALTLATLEHRGKSVGNPEKGEEALRLYRETIQMVPNSWVLYNQLGEAHLRLRRFEEALEIFDQSIDISGDNLNAAVAWNLKGSAYRFLIRFQEAIAAFEKSVKLDANGRLASDGFSQLAKLYGDMGNADLAEVNRSRAEAVGAN